MGGKAESAGLKPGDIILKINSNDAGNLTHIDAQNQVKTSKTTLSLTIERYAIAVFSLRTKNVKAHNNYFCNEK